MQDNERSSGASFTPVPSPTSSNFLRTFHGNVGAIIPRSGSFVIVPLGSTPTPFPIMKPQFHLARCPSTLKHRAGGGGGGAGNMCDCGRPAFLHLRASTFVSSLGARGRSDADRLFFAAGAIRLGTRGQKRGSIRATDEWRMLSRAMIPLPPSSCLSILHSPQRPTYHSCSSHRRYSPISSLARSLFSHRLSLRPSPFSYIPLLPPRFLLLASMIF